MRTGHIRQVTFGMRGRQDTSRCEHQSGRKMLAKNRRMFGWTAGSSSNRKRHPGPLPAARRRWGVFAVLCNEAKREKLQALRERASALQSVPITKNRQHLLGYPTRNRHHSSEQWRRHSAGHNTAQFCRFVGRLLDAKICKCCSTHVGWHPLLWNGHSTQPIQERVQ